MGNEPKGIQEREERSGGECRLGTGKKKNFFITEKENNKIADTKGNKPKPQQQQQHPKAKKKQLAHLTNRDAR